MTDNNVPTYGIMRTEVSPGVGLARHKRSGERRSHAIVAVNIWAFDVGAPAPDPDKLLAGPPTHCFLAATEDVRVFLESLRGATDDAEARTGRLN